MKALFSRNNKKRNRKTLIIAAVAMFGIVILFRSGYKYFKMKDYRDSLREEIEELKKENVKTEKRIKDLYNDKEYVEKVAREQLNLVKDGETVYIIADE